MEIKLSAIERDTSIQCRATIDTGIVNEYAERMLEIAENGGEKFPAIIVFGTKDKCWPGDGWHRIMAVEQLGEKDIDADLRPGGRIDALKFALSANALHGHRRTKADKRRCIEIALKEFPTESARKIAERCGVGNQLVSMIKKENPQLCDSHTSKVTGRDGKQYLAIRKQKEPPDKIEQKEVEPPHKQPKEKKLTFQESVLESTKANYLMLDGKHRKRFRDWMKSQKEQDHV